MSNWLCPRNPWNLPAPPAWVLAKLAEYDRELVIVPGIKEPVYRLMRRSGRAKLLKALTNDSELAQAITLGLMPVTSILQNPNWHSLFHWLRAHDIWAAGGPEQAEQLLLEQEARQKIDIEEKERDDLGQIGASAWFAKQLRNGEATFVQEGRKSTS
jgi:hypothetical protein